MRTAITTIWPGECSFTVAFWKLHKFTGKEQDSESSARVMGVARVPLDKSEVPVKSVVVLGGAQAPPVLPERLRTKTLEISR